MYRVVALARSLWRGLRKPAQLDADMADEMRFHIDMEARRLMTRGLDEQEARRRAAVAFGGVEKYRGAARDALRFTWARGVSVDIKLGVRMLGKYPGLTAVAVFALSLAIGAGAAYLEFVNDMLHGRLPFANPERIVGIQNWDQQSGDAENRSTFDFVTWRDGLSSFEHIGAYRALDRNLITEDGRAEPVRGVEISASAFRIAGVAPVLGRPLVPEDERTGAAPVVVLGHDVWVNRFASDPTVVGRFVRVGNAPHTIVGVMPATFGFPTAHSLWVPLRLNEAQYPRRAGAAIKIFGKLAPGVGMSGAQAELTAMARRLAGDYPDTHRHLNPVVKGYVDSLWSTAADSELQRLVLYSANLFFLGLLGLCGANIATLVFARTATRDTEISVRTALGASRARIAGQLFAEALVLSSIAAIAGLTVAYYGLQWVKHTVTVASNNRLMFWWNDQLSPETFVYAAVLAVGAAVIIGVVPALKATGVKVQERLRSATGGSAAGLKFGGIWTGVIVTQVGVTVIFLSIVGTIGWGLYFGNAGNRQVNFAASQYVGARVTMDADANMASTTEDEAQFRNRFRALFTQFADRVASEPGVAGVTFGAHYPNTNLTEMPVEVDGVPLAAVGERAVQTTSVATDFLATFDAPLVAGRAFTAADSAPGQNIAIVDQTFVRQVLGGQEAVGRRLRHAGFGERAPGPWIEIVGVVKDLTVDINKTKYNSVVYRPAAAEALHPIRVALRVHGDPSPMLWRVRVIAAEVDASLRLDEVMTLDRVGTSDRVAIAFFLRVLAGIGVVALVLATAGMYALMAFTVARRTSEIGIRLALGANPRRIVFSTFARALAQMGAGVIIGSVPAAALAVNLAPEVSAGADPIRSAALICAISAVFMATVTALACVVPARRALRIQPIETLKAT
jgi:predicted permease